MKKFKFQTKQLKFHCSLCQTLYQLLESQELRLKAGKVPFTDNPCPNNCLIKWQTILHDYCQEKIFAYLAKQEQTKDEKETLVSKLDQIRKENHRK